MHLFTLVWLNWYVICDDWVIDSYVIILVEMKLVYWGLKGNKCIMVTHASICFNMIELLSYVWWLSYRLICNHFGWNETGVLGLKTNQGTMVTYAPISFKMVEMIWLLLWLNDEYICNHLDWNEIKVLEIERKSRYDDCKWIIIKSIGLK